MDILHALLVLLNYFWLSDDPVESASWYCDQHCFKVGSEVIESAWDAVLAICPRLGKLADDEGIPTNNRKRRHAGSEMLWHPFTIWNGFCRENLRRSLVNADAIFAEHERRTGKQHNAWTDCKFLAEHVDEIDFNSNTWLKWWLSQNGSSNTKYTPSKTKPAKLRERKEWCAEMGLRYRKTDDRNTMEMTTPGQYINEKTKDFTGCKVEGDVVKAYHNYYNAKANTVGGGMRYYYTKPPGWLSKEAKAKLLTVPKGKIKGKPKAAPRLAPKPKKITNRDYAARRAGPERYIRDAEGNVIVEFVFR